MFDPGGPEGGRSRLGVARGVLRVPGLEPCVRALPIPALLALGGRVTPDAPPDSRPFMWLVRLPFSFLAEGGRRRGAELLPGRGVGVFGRPLAPGRGVGVFRVGLRPLGPPLALAGDAFGEAAADCSSVSAIVVARLRGGEVVSAAPIGRPGPRCEFHARAGGAPCGPLGRVPARGRKPSEEGREMPRGPPFWTCVRTATALRSLSSTGASDSSFCICFFGGAAFGAV